MEDPLDIIIGRLRSEDPGERITAVQMLGDSKSQDPKVIRALIEQLNDPHIQIQLLVVNTLITTDWPVVSYLMEAAEDGRPNLRSNAIMVLGKMRVSTAIPTMLNALHDSDGRVYGAACVALGSIGDLSVLPRLVEKLADPEVRGRALDALANLIPECGMIYEVNEVEKTVREADREAAAQLQVTIKDRRKELREKMAGVLLKTKPRRPKRTTKRTSSFGKLLQLFRFRRR